MVALSVHALLRPAAAGPVLAGATGMVAVFTVADSAFGVVPRDDWGPVAAVAVFALAVALAFLGLHRARLAGLLIILAGIAQLTATLIGVVIEAADGAGLGAAFGGSSGVVVLPLLVIGGLFLLAGSLQDLNGSGPGRVATGGGGERTSTCLISQPRIPASAPMAACPDTPAGPDATSPTGSAGASTVCWPSSV